MLGEPKGLSFATPLRPWTKTIRSTTVELWGVFNDEDIRRTASHDPFEPLHRQLLVGWDTQAMTVDIRVPSNVSSSHLAQPNTLAIWATDAAVRIPRLIISLALPSVQVTSAKQTHAAQAAMGSRSTNPPLPTDDDTAISSRIRRPVGTASDE